MSIFKEYLKENFVHKKIIQIKRNNEVLDISIFPNGRLYDMNGEYLGDEDINKVWKILYKMGKEGKLDVFEEK
jgi:hypothetical protein